MAHNGSNACKMKRSVRKYVRTIDRYGSIYMFQKYAPVTITLMEFKFIVCIYLIFIQWLFGSVEILIKKKIHTMNLVKITWGLAVDSFGKNTW